MRTSRTKAVNSLDNMKAMLDERAELQAAKKRIEEQIKSLDEVIRPVLAERGAPVIWNGWEHKVTKRAGRKSVDYKQMAEDYDIDLDDYTKEGSPYTVYELKQVEEL